MLDIKKIIENARIIYSQRETISMQLSDDGNFLVKAPVGCPKKDIEKFIERSENWIKRSLKRYSELKDFQPFTLEEIQEMADKALEVIPQRVKFYAEKIGVTYGRITVRNQRIKWGSCGLNGNMNFNSLLMATPMEVVDSVVVHELCHRRYMDHSKEFYEEIYRVYPDYDKWDKWLKDNGGLLIKRMLAAYDG